MKITVNYIVHWYSANGNLPREQILGTLITKWETDRQTDGDRNRDREGQRQGKTKNKK